METTEVEVADDLLAEGWAAPVAAGPDQREFERVVSLTIAQANIIHERDEANADLRRQLAAAVGGRGDALRLEVENRGLRERVALQHATILRLRRDASPRRGRWIRWTRAADPDGAR